VRTAAGSASGGDTVRRYADVARAMGEPERSAPLDFALAGAARVRALCEALRVPKLSAFGVTRDAFPDLVARAKLTSSMKANPVELSDEALAGILERAIG
jgi:alcohol dehydrogenase class IV